MVGGKPGKYFTSIIIVSCMTVFLTSRRLIKRELINANTARSAAYKR